MKSTFRLTLGIVVLAAVAGFAALWLAPAEPRVEGRPLGDLLQELVSPSEPARRAASEALRKSAAKVVPLLVEMARADDAEFTKKMKALAERGQLESANIAAPSVRRAQALNGFRALGPAAAPATPALTQMLRDPKTSVAAALALACIGGEALNPLIETVVDSNPRIAGNARTALDSLTQQSSGAAPVLIPRLKDKNPQIRAVVARAVGRVGQDSARAIPVLTELLDDTDADVRLGASFGLGAFGDKARSALAKLLPLAKQTMDKSLHDTAGIAIWRIDPDEAKKAGLDEALIKSPAYTGPVER